MNTLSQCTIPGTYKVGIYLYNVHKYIEYEYPSAEGAVVMYEGLVYDATHPRLCAFGAVVRRLLRLEPYPILKNVTITLKSGDVVTVATYSNRDNMH